MLRKHFIDNSAFQTHIKSKPHKRRLHALKETTILNFLGRGGVAAFKDFFVDALKILDLRKKITFLQTVIFISK